MSSDTGKIIEQLASGGRILVTRLQYLGDVVLTLPLVKALKSRFPEAGIDYLCKEPGAGLLEGESLFDHVYKIPEKGFSATLRLISRLRKRKYALVIDLLSNPRSAILTGFTGAGVRIGGSRRIRRWLYTHQISVPSSIRAATAIHLYHLTPLGIRVVHDKPSLQITDEERQWSRALFDNHRDEVSSPKGEGVPCIGIHPGGKWEVKRWPVEYFAQLSTRLSEKIGARIFIFCGPGEETFARQLHTMLDGRAALLPLMPIREVAAVLEQLDCFVAGDGGITHVSVAVGTPTVAIFGSSEPDIWFPYEGLGSYFHVLYPVDCRPCHLHTCDHLSCLKKLSAEKVEEKVLRALGGQRNFCGAHKS